MKVALSFVAFRRPIYTDRVLAAISSQPELNVLPAVVSLDFWDHDLQDELHKIALRHLKQPTVILHTHKIGCNQNTLASLTCAFDNMGADAVIHVEDDVLLSQDAGQWFMWALERYRDDKDVWTVGGWEHGRDYGFNENLQCKIGPATEGRLEQERLLCAKQGFFSAWGWATWKDRWQEMARGWTADRKDTYEGSWDCQVGRIRGNRKEMVPLISRAQNVGSDAGVHRGCCILPIWEPNRTNGNYSEIVV